jgi:glyceraldehyde 3-phosphate dehydrogenase
MSDLKWRLNFVLLRLMILVRPKSMHIFSSLIQRTVASAHPVVVEDDAMVVNGDRIAVFAERNPEDLPWGDLNIDVVFECTGIFTSRDKASAHLRAGARKVLISAPSNDADATIVYGVNHDVINDEAVIVSNASCTTNCLAPIVAP